MSQCTVSECSLPIQSSTVVGVSGVPRGPWRVWRVAVGVRVSDPAQTHDHFIIQISRISTVGLRPYCANQRAASLCAVHAPHVLVHLHVGHRHAERCPQCLSAGSGTVRVVCGDTLCGVTVCAQKWVYQYSYTNHTVITTLPNTQITHILRTWRLRPCALCRRGLRARLD